MPRRMEVTPRQASIVDRFLAAIPVDEFTEVRDRWFCAQDDERRQKYLDLGYWAEVNARRATELGLDVGPPRRVLDLGCGAGYFLRVCELLGHVAVGVDRLERRSMYNDLRAMLGVTCVPHTIRPMEPLPDLGGGFDVVTAHMVCFNGHRTDRVWGPAEWSFLLDDVDAPLVSIQLNAEPDGTLYSGELLGFFQECGAEVDRHRVTIRRALPVDRARRER